MKGGINIKYVLLFFCTALLCCMVFFSEEIKSIGKNKSEEITHENPKVGITEERSFRVARERATTIEDTLETEKIVVRIAFIPMIGDEPETTKKSEPETKKRSEQTTKKKTTKTEKTTKKVTQKKNTTKKSGNVSGKKIYSASYFRKTGRIHYGGYDYTWYPERVLPGKGLKIPGRHNTSDGYVVDSDNRLVLASCDLKKGTVVETPFGTGVVRDYCPIHGTIDVYTSW